MTEPCQLAGRGYALLPLKPRSKEPHAALLKNLHGSARWKPLAESPATPADVDRWQEYDPALNFGIITGPPSRLAVLDVDYPEKMPLQHFPIPPPFVSTGRGFHLYFRDDDTRTRRLPFGELKGSGGYVVCPPSCHPDGSHYFWSVSLLNHDPPPLPEWLKENESTHNKRENKRECLSRYTECLSREREREIHLLSLSTLLRHSGLVVDLACLLGNNINDSEQKITCPFHPQEKRPSANFYKTRDGSYMLKCWHTGQAARLGDVYRFHKTRRANIPDKVTAAVWAVRMCIELGYLKPPVTLAPLPHDAPEHTRKFFGGCVLLQQCRLIYDATNNSFPATVGFMTEWCGLKESDALSAKRWLVAHGFLVVHKRGQPYQHGRKAAATLYRLGKGNESETWRR